MVQLELLPFPRSFFRGREGRAPWFPRPEEKGVGGALLLPLIEPSLGWAGLY